MPNINLFESIIKSKEVIIFGAGSYGISSVNWFKMNDIRVNYIFDNDKNKWGKDIEGIKIISPENVSLLKEDGLVICSSYYEEINKQLLNLGINNTIGIEEFKKNFEQV